MSDHGLITVRSAHPVAETIDRLVTAVTSRGLTVFARIDHAANAAHVQLELRPTQLLIFGNPGVGTSLMQDCQSAGLDLPVRALAWEDAVGTVWLTYEDAHWLARRHGLGEASARAVAAIATGLAVVSEEAISSAG